MKFVHISDLHIGKRLKDMSMEDDQRYILSQIVSIVSEESPDGVIIAGDVYDTTTPNTDSVTILDNFLTELNVLNVPVFMISGNHDSPEKLGFGSRLFEANKLFISGVFNGALDVHTVSNGSEQVDICMLPFVKPINVRRKYPEESIENYTDAVRTVIAHTDLTKGRKRIMVAHQFVISGSESPELSDSEVSMGGLDSVDASVFDDFDYVALGHIHKAQPVGRETIRYCGTPLKYSASESRDDKTVTIVDIGEDVRISTRPLKPLRDLRRISGPLNKLIEVGRNDPGRNDFIYATLESDEIEALTRLRQVYPNVMSIEVAGTERKWEMPESVADDWNLDIVDAFKEFYEVKMGTPITESQLKIVRDTIYGEGSE